MLSSATDACLLRRRYDPTALVAAHPPRLRHGNKRVAFERACPPGAVHGGTIELTRWATAALPERGAARAVEVEARPGYYDYAGPSEGVWHVNFADPELFVAYGSALLAQDELQAVEHPLLGCLREALRAEGQRACTEVDGQATPVLVRGVERRVALDTAPTLEDGRVHGLYGNRFAAAAPATIERALRVLAPPTASNLIAMAAPAGGRGRYTRHQLVDIVTTAYTAFAAAVGESHAAWPGTPVEVVTGFWGCGAFGGNRRVMTCLQLLAARLAGVDRVCFHTADEAGRDDFAAGAADLARVLATGDASTAAVLDRLAELDHAWGSPNGT